MPPNCRRQTGCRLCSTCCSASKARLLSAVAREALSLALGIDYEHDRLHTLVELIPNLPEDAKREAVPKALELVEQSPYVSWNLTHLAPHIPAALLPEALAMTRKIPLFERYEALKSLAPRLPEELLPEALTVAREIDFKPRRAEALAALAARLATPLREEVAREAVLAIDDPIRVIDLLSPFLSDALLEDVFSLHKSSPPLIEWLAKLELLPARLYPFWGDWFSQAITRLPTGTRKDICAVLANAAGALAAVGGAEAVAEAYSSVQDATRWWP